MYIYIYIYVYIYIYICVRPINTLLKSRKLRIAENWYINPLDYHVGSQHDGVGTEKRTNNTSVP